ncbi:hypothetical protein F0562_004019 [Nyssa sinensis]|uniref:Uncharacterized protein n=1 Tax=Nyssa sinensis TaxID=561372 RepID=A0A5J5C091_9ASTE|nr:hypothetical protein F0562_004019 [Nyssa sinensis]
MLTFLNHKFLSRHAEQKKNKSGSMTDTEIQLRTKIKQLYEASSLSQPSTFAKAAKLRRMAAAKEKELAKRASKDVRVTLSMGLLWWFCYGGRYNRGGHKTYSGLEFWSEGSMNSVLTMVRIKVGKRRFEVLVWTESGPHFSVEEVNDEGNGTPIMAEEERTEITAPYERDTYTRSHFKWLASILCSSQLPPLCPTIVIPVQELHSKDIKLSYDSYLKVLMISKVLTYFGLICSFWRVPVAAISEQLVQPFGTMLSWIAGGSSE